MPSRRCRVKSFLDDYIGGLAGKALGIGPDDMIGGLAGKLMGRDQAEKNAMFGYLGGPLSQGNPFGIVGGLFWLKLKFTLDRINK